MNMQSKIHDTELSFEDFVKDLMSKRVRQGYPEEVNLYFKETYKAYTWTDGISSVFSIFRPLSNKMVQEILISD